MAVEAFVAEAVGAGDVANGGAGGPLAGEQVQRRVEDGRPGVAGLVLRGPAAARRDGRDPDAIGLEVWVSLGGLTFLDWAAEADAWRALGLTHLTVNTEFISARHRASEARTVAEHLTLLEQYRDAVGD